MRTLVEEHDRTMPVIMAKRSSDVMMYVFIFGRSSGSKYEHMHVKKKYIPKQGMLLCFKCKLKCTYL